MLLLGTNSSSKSRALVKGYGDFSCRFCNGRFRPQIFGQANTPLKRWLLDFASRRKEAELRSGVVRQDSLWDKLIFRKVQVRVRSTRRPLSLLLAHVSSFLVSTSAQVLHQPISFVAYMSTKPHIGHAVSICVLNIFCLLVQASTYSSIISVKTAFCMSSVYLTPDRSLPNRSEFSFHRHWALSNHLVFPSKLLLLLSAPPWRQEKKVRIGGEDGGIEKTGIRQNISLKPRLLQT